MTHTSASPATTPSTTPPALIDEDFLAQAGLAGADSHTLAEFAALLRHELEARVGAALSEGCSDEQLAVFEAFAARDMTTTRAWLADNYPDYAHSSLYRRTAAQMGVRPGGPEEDEVVCEFAAYTWLDTYRPDYPQVVARLTTQLRAETIAILTTHH